MATWTRTARRSHREPPEAHGGRHGAGVRCATDRSQDSFWIKTGDTAPSLEAQVLYEDDTPVNLSGASVKFQMRSAGAMAMVVDSAAAVIDSVQGIVRYFWAAGDTATAGTYFAELEVTFGDGTVLTAPNGDDYITVYVSPDIA